MTSESGWCNLLSVATHPMTLPFDPQAAVNRLSGEFSDLLIYNAHENKNEPLSLDFITKIVLKKFHNIMFEDVEPIHIKVAKQILDNLVYSGVLFKENDKYRLSNGVMSYSESNACKNSRNYIEQLEKDLEVGKIDVETFKKNLRQSIENQVDTFAMYV